MYNKIMIPVDLAHINRLEKAISTATDLAKHYGIPICVVGVTPETPSEVAHTPREYSEKLQAFAAAQAERHGLTIESAAYTSHDPAVDLAQTLVQAARKKNADLIVMASHVPGLVEHVFASNAGEVAAHSDVSVFIVR